MSISERLLFLLSRTPDREDYGSSGEQWASSASLDLLENEYARFRELVSNRKIVDFGCGIGEQSVLLVQKYNCTVVGIDSNQRTLGKAIEHAKPYNIPPSRLYFTDKISDSMLGNFDIVISQNSFEHFSSPSIVLNDMQKLLNASGKLLITFGPPWLAPYGSHMHFFCKVPWINVFFSEQTVMKVRNRYRRDGATQYEEVESGLNKMTIGKFEQLITSSNLNVEFKSYKCVKGIGALSKFPHLREYFINHVSVILSKATR